VREADLVVLAVKPQQMAEVARGIATPLAERRRVVVSIAAGIASRTSSAAGAGTVIVRADAQRQALTSRVTALYAGSGARLVTGKASKH